MKTTTSLSRKVETIVTGLTFILMVSVFFTSCKKEELLQPGKPQTANVNARQANISSLPIQEMAFVSIEIDHRAGDTRSVDYNIILYSDGSCIYTGRANVAVYGVREFEISKKALSVINALSKEFNSASGVVKHDVEKLMCLSMVTTTYTPNNDAPKIFTDFNNGTPAKLVSFRNAVEKTMSLDKYTKSADYSHEEASEN